MSVHQMDPELRAALDSVEELQRRCNALAVENVALAAEVRSLRAFPEDLLATASGHTLDAVARIAGLARDGSTDNELRTRVSVAVAMRDALADHNAELSTSLVTMTARVDELEARQLLPATTRLQASVGLPPASEDVAKRYRDFARSAFEHEDGIHVDDDEEVCADEDGAYITACIYVSSAQLEEDGVR